MSKDQQGSGASSQMTPEQMARLKSFGKKNGVSQEKLQSQLPTQKPTVQPVPATRLQPKAQVVAQQPVQEVKQTVQTVRPEEEVYAEKPVKKTLEEPCQTYFALQDEEAGNLEIDLITFREKGLETRYLSLVFSGIDVRQNPPVPQEAFLNIESKEAFEALKDFFAQLDWED